MVVFGTGTTLTGTYRRPTAYSGKEKIERNKLRDERNKAELKRLGWGVMTIWECQLKPAVREQTLLEMEYWINHSYLERLRMKTGKTYGETTCRSVMAAEDETVYGKDG